MSGNFTEVRETILTDDDIYHVVEPRSSETLDQDIPRLEEQLAEERERGLRTLAEFDNYRKRTRRELAVAQDDGKREVLLPLLDVMDDFDRALVHIAGASDSIVDGVHLIRQRINEVLHSNGVTTFDSEGQAFDPMVHEAISVIDTDDEGQSGNVFAEQRRGYLMKQLLRPARVAVLKVKQTE